MKRFVIILTLLTSNIIAQPAPPQFQPVPIDGGLIMLLAAGAAYGSKKIAKKKTKE